MIIQPTLFKKNLYSIMSKGNKKKKRGKKHKNCLLRIVLFRPFSFFHAVNFATFVNFTFVPVLRSSSFLLPSIFVFDRLIAVQQTTRKTADCPETISGDVFASLPETNVLKWELGTTKDGKVRRMGWNRFFLSLCRKFEQNLRAFSTRWRQITTYRIQSSLFFFFTYRSNYVKVKIQSKLYNSDTLVC